MKCMVCHQEYPNSRKNFICFDCYSELDLHVHNSEIQKKTSEEEQPMCMHTKATSPTGVGATIVGHLIVGVNREY